VLKNDNIIKDPVAAGRRGGLKKEGKLILKQK
jgi:hypothetical protein